MRLKFGGVDEDFQEELSAKRAQLPPTSIGREGGRIMEWLEDYEEQDPRHRHVSHLYGLYPANEITEKIKSFYGRQGNVGEKGG